MQNTLSSKAIGAISAALMVSYFSFGQAANKPVEYLQVASPIVFDKQSFLLSWSSHPTGNYYKQEYLVKGEVATKYKSMLMLEVETDNQDLKNVVNAKVSELKKMKETNPIVNYEIIQNPSTGEYILDFLLTANSADGNISIIERNVYRYGFITDKSGKKGIQLFGVSTRGYAPGIDSFLSNLKATRKDLVNKVAQFKIPPVAL